jgi:predicted transposase/invertase (TIGR01784 family)
MRERIIFYLSKLITEQIGKGTDYENIKRGISIVITDYILAPESSAYHDQFFLYSELTKTRFSDIVEIDTLELPKLPADRSDDKLWQWTKFLAGKKTEDFTMLTQQNPAINKAVGVLMELNASQRRRMLAESREKARRDERARLKGAYTSGKEEGRLEGAARAYKEMGIRIADIATKTGLSVEEIERL